MEEDTVQLVSVGALRGCLHLVFDGLKIILIRLLFFF